MRKLAILLAPVLLLALIISGSGCGGEGTPKATPTPTPASDEKITFPDANLEAAVRDAIGKPTGDIRRSDLEGRPFLFAEGRGIVDLSGLEYCASLNRLYLWENRIVDISPLSNLSSLEGLYLRDNQISDISPLSNLTRLSSIDLGENQITDISALVENSGLDSGDTVDLRDNPLSTASVDVYVPQLEQREVRVLWTWPPTSYGIHVTSSAPGAGGVPISYSGNYTGTGETPLDIGPGTSPFTVTLQAPFGLEPLCLCCPCWSVDGSEPACYHDITIAVDDAHRERTVIVSYMLYSPLPCRFHGTVQVDGADVPDGTVITTTVQGDTYTSTYSTTTPADFGSSTYALEIWDFSTCHAEGAPIAFMIGDRAADQTATWIAGGDIELNLSASTTAIPTPSSP